MSAPTQQLSLTPTDNRRLASLCGQFNEHLQQVEQQLKVQISHRGNSFHIHGKKEATQTAKEVLQKLYHETAETKELSREQIHLVLVECQNQFNKTPTQNQQISTSGKTGIIKPRSKNQQLYLKNLASNDINFAIGPAGTGKTYLAVACAVDALEHDTVKRLIITRPAVEAGERLGFLPGDLNEKVDPYLRPLYDALYDMLGLAHVNKLLEKNVIEIAPLAFMRGRTLNDAYIILDEAQNTTPEQMKMFLTRIGFGSTAVITGDISQTDLPRDTLSGLKHAIDVLKNIDDISFTYFESQDAVRHSLVEKIVNAYANSETNISNDNHR